MSDEYTNGVIAGLRAAGVIADRIADELEYSRCQQVATRIRHEIVQAIRSHESAPAPRVSQPRPFMPGERPMPPSLDDTPPPDASPGTPEGPRCQECNGTGKALPVASSATFFEVAREYFYTPESERPTCPACRGTPSTPRGAL